MKLKYRNCLELAQELPWFELDPNGLPRLADPASVGPIIDFHQHFALMFFFSPPVDLHVRTDSPVMHDLRLDSVPVNLGLYSGVNLARARRHEMHDDYKQSFFSGEGPKNTHTAPNLLDEMDRCNIERGVILAVDFPFGIQNSQAYLDACDAYPRFVPYVAVNPLRPGWEERLDRFVDAGAKGLKVHPYTNLLPCDHPRVMKVLKRWERTGLPILFHTASNGVEPDFLRMLSRMRTYRKPLKEIRNCPLIMGHCGMDYYPQAIDFAQEYDNVYLEIGGQPPSSLAHVFEHVDHNRILFGTDWPVYPLMLPLAKALIATDGDHTLRRKILYENGRKLLLDSGAWIEPSSV
jgi:hypothetical protein